MPSLAVKSNFSVNPSRASVFLCTLTAALRRHLYIDLTRNSARPVDSQGRDKYQTSASRRVAGHPQLRRPAPAQRHTTVLRGDTLGRAATARAEIASSAPKLSPLVRLDGALPQTLDINSAITRRLGKGYSHRKPVGAAAGAAPRRELDLGCKNGKRPALMVTREQYVLYMPGV